jgi:hypothetical protein
MGSCPTLPVEESAFHILAAPLQRLLGNGILLWCCRCSPKAAMATGPSSVQVCVCFQVKNVAFQNSVLSLAAQRLCH